MEEVVEIGSSGTSIPSNKSDSGIWDKVWGKTVVSESTTTTFEEYLPEEQRDVSREIRKKVEEKRRRFLEEQRRLRLTGSPPPPSGIAVVEAAEAEETLADVATQIRSLQLHQRPSLSPPQLDVRDEMVEPSTAEAVSQTRREAEVISQGTTPPQAPPLVPVTSTGTVAQEDMTTSLCFEDWSSLNDRDIVATSTPKSGKGNGKNNFGSKRATTPKRPSLVVSSRRIVLSPPKRKSQQKPSSPQPGTSSMARPPKGKASGKISLGKQEKSREEERKVRGESSETTTRYVGYDVFGNYRMMRSMMVKQIVEQERPDMKNLEEETIKKLTRNINHYLEDFFVHHCEQTPHPYGFIPFKQLLDGLISQNLLPKNADMNYFIRVMKECVSEEDFKKSTGVLFPSKNSRSGDTDQYLYQ